VWSDDLVDEANQTRAAVERALGALDVDGELVLTGGASVTGALTKGDIDLHLRVAPGTFPQSIARLRRVYPVASPQSWAATLAVFEVPAARPTGLAVTPVGSEHDRRFCLTWQAIRRDPALLARYNVLKSETVGTDEYEHRKSAFFSAIVSASGHGGGTAGPRPGDGAG